MKLLNKRLFIAIAGLQDGVIELNIIFLNNILYNTTLVDRHPERSETKSRDLFAKNFIEEVLIFVR